jgi:anti-sigma regulatory factor (Ser/Thr protein kinase)
VTDALVIPVPGTLSETARLREAVARYCDAHGVSAEASLHVKLALEEVVVNVIAHGYRHAPGRIVEVRLELANGTLTATVTDDAAAFDPLQAPAPDVTAPLEARPAGGLGVFLARRLMDRVVYRREGDRNILVLTKRVA